MTSDYADDVVENAGATKPVRDSVDTEHVQDYYDNIQHFYRTSEISFPSLSGGPAPGDADKDGMSDSWETARGLNPSVNDSAGDDDNNGYTNIEEYFHYLGGVPAAAATPLGGVPEAPARPTNLRIVSP